MTNINLAQLAQDPVSLLDRVEAGETFVVMRDGRAVAELRPIATPNQRLVRSVLLLGVSPLRTISTLLFLKRSCESLSSDEIPIGYSYLSLVHHR
jgi:antitoxin (DNA-binding transcriptional repressor) of toxin-antitoxin stability system